jgi:hypothetical protein
MESNVRGAIGATEIAVTDSACPGEQEAEEDFLVRNVCDGRLLVVRFRAPITDVSMVLGLRACFWSTPSYYNQTLGFTARPRYEDQDMK